MDRKRLPIDGVNDPKCIERFWKKVGEPDEHGCRLWRNRKHRVGTFAGGPAERENGTYRRLVKAHAFAWTLANGPIPDDLVVRHQCASSLCCEASHLELGTQEDNIRDMRWRFKADNGGEGPGNPKLSHDEVREIHRLTNRGDMTIMAVANMFNISRTHAGYIKAGRTRAYVLDESRAA